MKIILAIKSGLFRALKAWKGILIFWFISLIMVSFLTFPLKASLNAVFGNSMVIEKLVNGINVDVLGDMGSNLHSIISSLFSGILILSLVSLLINAFITGGLFDSLRRGSERFTTENFFRTSAKNFWSFVIITAILYLIIIFLIVIVIIIPVSIAGTSESAPEGIVFRTLSISCPVFLAAMSVIFLVADYARAWQASRIQNECFKALGFGFSQTFRHFFSSLTLMILMFLFQALPAAGVIRLIAGYTPSKGGQVFLLFIISQVLIAFKIFLKTLRYASVTSLMELTSTNDPPIPENPLKSDKKIPQNFSNDLNVVTDV
jgi:hypothetical protein